MHFFTNLLYYIICLTYKSNQKMEAKNIIAFGGGVNSVALVLLLRKEKIKYHEIIFSDTGSEHPETYQYLQFFQEYLGESITIVKKNESLYENCIRYKRLPSIAYGIKGCSVKFKIEPFDKYIKNMYKNCNIVKFVGIDAGESHRVKNYENLPYKTRYPLVEFGLDRQDCVKLIQDHSIPVPRKSACFFCPSTKRYEILQLEKEYPDLLQKALEMEQNAELTSIKGLGRNWSWYDYIKNKQLNLFDSVKIDCICDC